VHPARVERDFVLPWQNEGIKYLFCLGKTKESDHCFALAKRENQILVLPGQNERIKYLFCLGKTL
jgi:hypothetical protein